MEISHFSAFSMPDYARFAANVSQAPSLILLLAPTVPSLACQAARLAARLESNWIAKSTSSPIAGHAQSPGLLLRLHDSRRADDCRHMVGSTPNLEGARRWLYYSAGQKRIQGRFSRLSAGEPLEPSTLSRSAGFSLEGSRSLARSPAWRSSRRLHGIIFMNGFGRPFPGGAADWIDLRANENRQEEGPVHERPQT